MIESAQTSIGTATQGQGTDSQGLNGFTGEAAAVSPADLSGRAMEAVSLCRAGRWREGHAHLERVAAAAGTGERLPALFYSYLGYVVAWREGRWSAGLALCRRAVELEIFQPEGHLNLARVHLLRHRRRAAVECLTAALRLEPDNRAALRLWGRIGRRRRPVLAWLSRNHFLNRILGRIRHDLKS